MKRLVVVALSVAALSMSSGTAAPAAVTLHVTAAEPLVAGALAGPCDLTVPSGADGFDVLDEAVDDGCIDSYRATGSSSDPYGRFLVCVEALCDPTGDGLVLYWRFGLNGSSAEEGLDGYAVSNGDVISVSFTSWAGCMADQDLC